MTDERLDIVISRILRGGVTLAAGIVLAGGIWHLAEAGGEAVPYRHFSGTGGIHALLGLPPAEAVILAGLLLLIATPVARVAFSLVAFALERDWTYVTVTVVVLGVLLYSILSGI